MGLSCSLERIILGFFSKALRFWSVAGDNYFVIINQSWGKEASNCSFFFLYSVNVDEEYEAFWLSRERNFSNIYL